MAKPVIRAGALAAGVAAAGAAQAQSMTLTSPQIKEGATIANEQVFKGFGCKGGNVSPALNWSGAPSGTKSFAVTDLRSGRADRQRLVALGRVQYSAGRRRSLPKGAGDAKARCRRGRHPEPHRFRPDGYGGPCPPPGDKPHRYQFTVFAVDVDKLPMRGRVHRPLWSASICISTRSPRRR